MSTWNRLMRSSFCIVTVTMRLERNQYQPATAQVANAVRNWKNRTIGPFSEFCRQVQKMKASVPKTAQTPAVRVAIFLSRLKNSQPSLMDVL